MFPCAVKTVMHLESLGQNESDHLGICGLMCINRFIFFLTSFWPWLLLFRSIQQCGRKSRHLLIQHAFCTCTVCARQWQWPWREIWRTSAGNTNVTFLESFFLLTPSVRQRHVCPSCAAFSSSSPADSGVLCCHTRKKTVRVVHEELHSCMGAVALQWTPPSARDYLSFYKVWVRKNLLDLFQLWLPSYLGISRDVTSRLALCTHSHNRHFVLSLGAATFSKRSYSLSQRWWFPSTSPRSPIVCLSCLIFHPRSRSSTSEQAVCSPPPPQAWNERGVSPGGERANPWTHTGD